MASRGLSIVGGVGMILLGIAAITYWSMYLIYWLFLSGILPWIAMAGVSAFIFIAAIMAGLGLLSLKLNYGKSMGLIGFIFTFIFGWWILVSDIMTVVGIDFATPIRDINGYHVSIDSVIWFLGFFFIGLLLLFWGIALIMTAKPMGKTGLAIAAGAMLLLAGIFYMVNIAAILVWEIAVYNVLGPIFLLIGGMLAAVVFFMAKGAPATT